MYGDTEGAVSGQSGCIAMVSFGPVAQDLQESLRAGLEPIFRIALCLTGQVLPLAGWNAERQQYLGEALLAELHRVWLPDALRVLALTEADLYADDLNFIFGEAEVGGPAAVVSLRRLRPEFYGHPPHHELFARRALVECIHELGHTFGLRHCPRPGCVMQFSDRIEESDRKGPGFCPVHRAALDAALRHA